jgi:hypothetical protein
VENVQSILKVIIAYDSQDEDLGSYFTACKEDIVGFLEEQKENGFPLEIIEIIDSRNCHTAYIDLQLAKYQNDSLLFIAYSHGLSHSLRCNRAGYIHSDNVSQLFHSWLYTNACSTAKELGIQFDGQNGVFIGFDKEIKAFKHESGLMQISINCDNCGIKYSISPHLPSAIQTYKAMKSYYNSQIDRLDELRMDAISLGYLRETRDALKIYGNKELKIIP